MIMRVPSRKLLHCTAHAGHSGGKRSPYGRGSVSRRRYTRYTNWTMPIRHVEQHASSPATVRDIVIGMSDGLTVPFALAAGLSGAVTNSSIVVLAGIAEIAAGSVAMGLGGYLAARTDEEHYHSERQREIDETREMPDEEIAEVSKVFQGWGLTDQQIEPIVEVISSDEKRWVDFMMKFELNLEEPDPKRALYSAATIAASYVVGGLIPLSPYMMHAQRG